MDKNEARDKVAELVKKYEQVKKSGRLSTYNEAETCKEFILPLFKALGWDTDSKTEVSAEEHTSTKDRSDYGFYLNGWPKFYLEAKKLSANLHDEKFAQQATTYSWNKGIAWAVLTDFENLIVFNAQDIAEHLSHKLFFDTPYSEYLERFEQLWWLSRESIEDNVLDKEAEKVGKKLQRVTVTDTLYKDLNKSREQLLKSFHTWNPEIDYVLLEEGVQKLLDRLIFIRVAEDRRLEQPTLTPMLRAHGGSSNEKFYNDLVAKFRELDGIYNSNLFAPHPLENWQEYDGATGDVINTLHGESGYYEYNFEAIPADILGSVYENYLGYKLSQSEKGFEFSNDARKRKDHGIYYTPAYIVDYIVSSALKPILDKCESIEDVRKIKVVDPACGSGSFLIRAMEMIFDWYKKYNPNADEFTKIDILLNNIYGVDLDEQAVEIARLNLLINALDSRMKLPDLSKNIKNGNSLINGSNEVLKKYFGARYLDKKPFNWAEEFPDVFNREKSGFDVVIGNPPYLSFSGRHKTEISDEDKAYLEGTYETMKGWPALHSAFIELALSISNNIVSFIVPDQVGHLEDYKILRSTCLRMAGLKSVHYWGEGIFQGVITPSLTFTLDKNYKGQTKVIDQGGLPIEMQISPDDKWLPKSDLVAKIENLKGVRSLDNLVADPGVHTGNAGKQLVLENSQNGTVPLLVGENIARYSCSQPTKYLNLDYQARGDEYFSIRPKNRYTDARFVIRQTAAYPIVGPRLHADYFRNSLLALYSPDDQTSVEYLVGVLNSSLIRYLYTASVRESQQKVFPQVKIGSLRKLPIKFIDFSVAEEKIIHDQVVELVKKMLSYQEELDSLERNSDNWRRIKQQSESTDKQIDELVNKIYKLTPEEISLTEI
jgi:type I restriction-modification system DNA methylase subunit